MGLRQRELNVSWGALSGAPRGAPRVALLWCWCLGWTLCNFLLGAPFLGALPVSSHSIIKTSATTLLPPPRLPLKAFSSGGPSPLAKTPLQWLGALRGGGLFGGSDPKKAKEEVPAGLSKGLPSIRLPNLLTLGPSHESDVVAVYVHPKRARQLQMQSGLPLELKGRRKRKTAGVLIEDPGLKEHEVSVHPRVYRHLKLVEGDLLLIEKLNRLPPAARVYVQVFQDTLPSFTSAANVTGREGPLEASSRLGPGTAGGPRRGAPQFSEQIARAVNLFFTSRPRPIRVGDQFKIKIPTRNSMENTRWEASGGPPDSGGPRTPGGPLGGGDPEGPIRGPNKVSETEEEIEVKVMRIDGDSAEDLEFALVGEGAEVFTGEETLDRG